MESEKIEDFDQLNLKNDSGLKKHLAIDGIFSFTLIISPKLHLLSDFLLY